MTAQTLVVQTITSSVNFVTGSTKFGALSSNTHQFTGSMYVTGALYVPTGSVGLGTTNPNTKFVISNNGLAGIEFDPSGSTLGGPSINSYNRGTSARWDLEIAGKEVQFYTGNPSLSIGLKITSGSAVGVGLISPRSRFQVAGLTGGATPGATGVATLGLANSSSVALFTNLDPDYGTLFGTLNTGTGWIQQQRVDGTATAYNLALQPSGGNVVIGRTTDGSAGARVSVSGGSLWMDFNTYFYTNSRYGSTVNYGQILLNNGTGQNLWLGETASNVYAFGNGSAGAAISTTVMSMDMLTGNVGIAGLNSIRRLYIMGASQSSGAYTLALDDNTGQTLFYVRNDGVGYLKAASWNYGSDRRLKENISDVESGLNVVNQLQPKHFDYINGEKNNVGFIAQDVQEVIPQAVKVNDEKSDMLSLKTDFIIPYLVKAIQELKAEIDALKAQ
jgi:hypothetical protein